MKPRLIIIDNHDSFTYNLVRIITDCCSVTPVVIKADRIDIDCIKNFDKILFSPGPEVPARYPVMNEILKQYVKSKSILGVCLGHQAIAEYYGAVLMNLPEVYHGVKTSVEVIDREEILFNEIPSGFDAGLYHSWAVEKNSMPNELKITALSGNGIVMAMTHKIFDVKGVQFHPESYMTQYGERILRNWIYEK